MVKVLCDMCGKEIDYNVDGVNIDINMYGVVQFKHEKIRNTKKQVCARCAAHVMDFIEKTARETD